MSRYIVILQPKNKFRGSYASIVVLVEADSKKEAIEKSGLEVDPDYQKPRAELAAFGQAFFI
jgi:hypothetical protein